MLNVLLVDDQPLYRKTLRTIVDWQSMDMRIIADVHNGQEALNIINTKSVDIVLTDMKMPVLSGLELIQSVQSKKPEIQFIALSAYDEFYLVKSAFKLGVKEYVLKSEISEERIREVVQNVKIEVEKMRVKNDHQKKMESYLDEKRFLLKNKLFKELISGKHEENIKVLEEMNILGANIKNNCLMMVIIACIYNCNTVHIKDKDEAEGLNIISDLRKILESYNVGEVFYNSAGEFIIILSDDDDNSEYALFQSAFMFYDKVEKEMSNKFGINIYGGISLNGYGCESITKIYKQASDASKYHFIDEKSRLVAFYSLKQSGIMPPELVAQKMELLKELLNESVYGRILEGTHLLKIDSRNVGIGDIDWIKELFEKYYCYIYDFAETHHVFEEMKPFFKKYSNGLRQYGNLMDLNAWIVDLLYNIGEVLLKGSQMVKNARRYIEQYYQEDISLISVAKEVGVNSSYLSRAFKKELGCNFIDYVSKLRIQVAIDFMQKSDMKIYEIAEKVGYPIPENFTRMFKKIVGKSPKKFFEK